MEVLTFTWLMIINKNNNYVRSYQGVNSKSSYLASYTCVVNWAAEMKNFPPWLPSLPEHPYLVKHEMSSNRNPFHV